jgi:hypothetical protein
MSGSLTIRRGRTADAQTLVFLVEDLALYEKLEHEARPAAAESLRRLFGPRPCAETRLAEVAGEAVRRALDFPTFATFRGQPGLYLEELELEGPQVTDPGLPPLMKLFPKLKMVSLGSSKVTRQGLWKVLQAHMTVEIRDDGEFNAMRKKFGEGARER